MDTLKANPVQNGARGKLVKSRISVLGRTGNNFLPGAKIKLSYRLCKSDNMDRKLNVSNVEASRNGFGLLASLPGDIPGFWVLCPHWAALAEALVGSLAATSPIPS